MIPVPAYVLGYIPKLIPSDLQKRREEKVSLSVIPSEQCTTTEECHAAGSTVQ